MSNVWYSSNVKNIELKEPLHDTTQLSGLNIQNALQPFQFKIGSTPGLSNTLATDLDKNYYEDSHYRPNVGNMIAAKIFKDKNINVPDDFGILVTKDNIDGHLKYLKKQIEKYDLNKKLK